jgi:glutamate dehydrogenase (NADP+)
MSCTDEVFRRIRERTSKEPQYLASVREFLLSLRPLVDYAPEQQRDAEILENILCPMKEISFHVYWTDGRDRTRITPAWRVEYTDILGPCKGGIRMKEKVSLDSVKSTGLDTLIRCTLTGQHFGGAKGGVSFDPEKHTDREIHSFLRSFVRELYRHIDPMDDILTPDVGMEGDIVEILVDEYRNYTNLDTAPLVGRLPENGGSPLKREGVGYGAVLLLTAFLRDRGLDLRKMTAVVSGAGSVGIAAMEKLQSLGATVTACSDTMGWVYDPNGIDTEKLKSVKFAKHTDLQAYAAMREGAEYHPGRGVWSIPADIGLPCAISQEINLDDAVRIAQGGIRYLCEGAFSPFTRQANRYLKSQGIAILPCRASSAGGIAVTGIEADAIAEGRHLSRAEYEAELRRISDHVWDQLRDTAEKYNLGSDYQAAADIAAYLRLRKAYQRRILR